MNTGRGEGRGGVWTGKIHSYKRTKINERLSKLIVRMNPRVFPRELFQPSIIILFLLTTAGFFSALFPLVGTLQGTAFFGLQPELDGQIRTIALDITAVE